MAITERGPARVSGHVRHILQTSSISASPSTGASGAESSRRRKEDLLMRSQPSQPMGVWSQRCVFQFSLSAKCAWVGTLAQPGSPSIPEGSDDVRLPSPNRRPEVSRGCRRRSLSGVWSPQIQISTPFPTPHMAISNLFIFTSSGEVSVSRSAATSLVRPGSIPQRPRPSLILSLGMCISFHLVFYT